MEIFVLTHPCFSDTTRMKLNVFNVSVAYKDSILRDFSRWLWYQLWGIQVTRIQFWWGQGRKCPKVQYRYLINIGFKGHWINFYYFYNCDIWWGKGESKFQKKLLHNDHLHTISQVTEESEEYSIEICLAFIDFRKVSDTVEHTFLFNALKNQRMLPHLIDIIKQLLTLKEAWNRVTPLSPL